MMCVDTLDVFARSDECPECSLQRKTGLLLIGITYRFSNETFTLRVSTLVHKQHLNDLILLYQKNLQLHNDLLPMHIRRTVAASIELTEAYPHRRCLKPLCLLESPDVE